MSRSPCTCGCFSADPRCPVHGSVPPVVPDSDALDCPECAGTGTVYVVFHYGQQEQDCGECGGSGVVPDKPALAPKERPRRPGVRVTDALRARAANAPVPAVTDDEAAKAILRPLFINHALSFHAAVQTGSDAKTPSESANEAIAVLRSAGFLIVHHTKET